jgi:hypothetical protein
MHLFVSVTIVLYLKRNVRDLPETVIFETLTEYGYHRNIN